MELITQKFDIEDVVKIIPFYNTDERGYFSTLFSVKKLEEIGINFSVVEQNFSYNSHNHTLRGMHYQCNHEQSKIVTCIRGKVQDIVIDIRANSDTFGQHVSVILNKLEMLYVPKGFAHGFLTLEDYTEMMYLMDDYFYPDESRGIAWNDPNLNLPWMHEPKVISYHDRGWMGLWKKEK